MKKIIGIIVLFVCLTSNQVLATEISAPNLLDGIVNQMDQIEDFRGTVVSRVFEDEQSKDFRVQIMKSDTRLMTEQTQEEDITELEKLRLLNSIPWLYLPPDYSIIKNSLPLEGQLDYDQPLKNLESLYELELLGEATYDEREVYIINLENSFSLQRIFIDQEWNTILRIEVFNGSNIKIANIIYDQFEEFELENSNGWLPTEIRVEDNSGDKLLEIAYQEWEINIGLTDFDFAEGFSPDYQTQIDQLYDQLDDEPEDDSLYFEISNLYQKSGYLEEAIENLQQAIELNDRVRYRKNLAELYKDIRDYDEALAEVRAALSSDYDDASLHFLEGQIRLQLGETNRARRSLERAVDRDSQNLVYLERLFRVYYNLADQDNNMLARSRRIIEDLVKLDDSNKRYKIYLGDIYRDKGRTAEAFEAYSQAIDLDPYDTWGHIKLARLYKQNGRYERAEELYRYILHLENTIENHERLADFYFDQGKYRLALHEYKAINERVTDDLDLELKLAEAYVAAGDVEEGIEIFEELLAAKEEGELYLEVAEVISRYQLKDAIDIYQQALAQEDLLTTEQQEEVYSRLGHIYFEEEKQRQFSQIQQLLNLDSQAKIYRLLGEYKFRAGELDQALSYFKVASERQEDIVNHYNLAVSYLLLDHFELAKVEGEKLQELGFAQGEELISLATELEKLQLDYEDKYVPGRINRIQADKLRRQGKLNEALIKYQEAILENYEYRLPYFYSGVIYALQGNNIKLRLAKNGLDDQEEELLTDLIAHLKQVNQF
ncbi:tetratricopeptide repeat protein [Natroniella sulfidigena]|uniref:tetratricopeptide repeat protein n=1 Tax=Natroniella sulfidigena TaxID=723921 RepID=UPI00200B29C3|nr:tetratricopeptide repeat protein [Natroniella sulfidigena]MCK8816138.1 tetratricopeptide repeat protein [Natroniella sulfidigena]